MLQREVNELRRMRNRMIGLAARLEHREVIGAKPITKKEAALFVWGFIADIKILLRDE